MCVCAYVCVCVCVRVYAHMYVYVCIHVCVSVYVHARMCACVRVYPIVCMCTYWRGGDLLFLTHSPIARRERCCHIHAQVWSDGGAATQESPAVNISRRSTTWCGGVGQDGIRARLDAGTLAVAFFCGAARNAHIVVCDEVCLVTRDAVLSSVDLYSDILIQCCSHGGEVERLPGMYGNPCSHGGEVERLPGMYGNPCSHGGEVERMPGMYGNP